MSVMEDSWTTSPDDPTQDMLLHYGDAKHVQLSSQPSGPKDAKDTVLTSVCSSLERTISDHPQACTDPGDSTATKQGGNGVDEQGAWEAQVQPQPSAAPQEPPSTTSCVRPKSGPIDKTAAAPPSPHKLNRLSGAEVGTSALADLTVTPRRASYSSTTAQPPVAALLSSGAVHRLSSSNGRTRSPLGTRTSSVGWDNLAPSSRRSSNLSNVLVNAELLVTASASTSAIVPHLQHTTEIASANTGGHSMAPTPPAAPHRHFSTVVMTEHDVHRSEIEECAEEDASRQGQEQEHQHSPELHSHGDQEQMQVVASYGARTGPDAGSHHQACSHMTPPHGVKLIDLAREIASGSQPLFHTAPLSDDNHAMFLDNAHLIMSMAEGASSHSRVMNMASSLGAMRGARDGTQLAPADLQHLPQRAAQDQQDPQEGAVPEEQEGEEGEEEEEEQAEGPDAQVSSIVISDHNTASQRQDRALMRLFESGAILLADDDGDMMSVADIVEQHKVAPPVPASPRSLASRVLSKSISMPSNRDLHRRMGRTVTVRLQAVTSANQQHSQGQGYSHSAALNSHTIGTNSNSSILGSFGTPSSSASASAPLSLPSSFASSAASTSLKLLMHKRHSQAARPKAPSSSSSLHLVARSSGHLDSIPESTEEAAFKKQLKMAQNQYNYGCPMSAPNPGTAPGMSGILPQPEDPRAPDVTGGIAVEAKADGV